jgi:two-component system, OmpR family, response regulator
MTKRELKRILYVEDEIDIQTVAKLALETVGGFTVEVCDTGRKAVDVAPKFKPDLILLDVMMPGMDGPTTFNALRSQSASADIPVIFMTAKAQRNEIAEYKRLGAIDVIPKPFDPMTLAQTVRDIWARHGHQT